MHTKCAYINLRSGKSLVADALRKEMLPGISCETFLWVGEKNFQRYVQQATTPYSEAKDANISSPKNWLSLGERT